MSERLDERLRRAARTYRRLGNHTAEGMFLEAADTICELQTENAKLRELMADMLRYYAMPNEIDYKREADLLERAHEMGVEVDA